MVVVMIYVSAHGYANGNLSKPFRATDANGVVCGEPGGEAESYPYAYFFNPTTFTLENRVCVKACPSYQSGTLSTLDCYASSCTYSVTILSDGTYSANPSTTTEVIGYETSPLIGRVCIPSSTVFAGAFASYVSTFSTYLSQGGFSTFITDL